jgi:hypothetical protein
MPSPNRIPHLLRTAERCELIVNGQPTLLLAGEVHNSATSCPAHLRTVFATARDLNCNALFVPVTWELVEPQEGAICFDLIDAMLAEARLLDLMLVPIWFGAYKNALSDYAPRWVKQDLLRFPRQQVRAGENTRTLCALSPEVMRCDARAFAQVMRHFKKADASGTTVVMVQVENEVGVLGGPRDRSSIADRSYAEGVPAQLRAAIGLDSPAHRGRGVDLCEGLSWEEAFGPDADEAFMCWAYARFVGNVAAAGRAEYDLPMFANAWLVQYPDQPAGQYPSGGPVAKFMNLWRAAAGPAIDLLAPDIYVDDFAGVCREYTRPGNPLLIPEARRDESMAAKALYALGAHDALAFAPFGIESVGLKGSVPIDGVVAAASLGQESSAFAARLLSGTYAILAAVMPQLLQARSQGRCVGFMQIAGEGQSFRLGNYRLTVSFRRPPEQSTFAAGGIVYALDDDQFVVIGFGFSILFDCESSRDIITEELHIDELRLVDGKLLPGRRLNGDERAARLPWQPSVRTVRMHRYPRFSSQEE